VSRPWGKQYAHMLNHPKDLRASIEERSAWHSLFLVALNSPRGEQLGSRDEVVAMLANLGHGTAAGERLDGLIRLHLVDVRKGAHRLHDWDDWQPSDPTGSKRKAAKRAGNVRGHAADIPRNGNSPATAGPPLDGDGESDTDSTPQPPSPARGARRRSKASTGVDASQYDRAMIRDEDIDAGDPDWVREPAGTGRR
jgi:hypothetical protein